MTNAAIGTQQCLYNPTGRRGYRLLCELGDTKLRNTTVEQRPEPPWVNRELTGQDRARQGKTGYRLGKTGLGKARKVRDRTRQVGFR